ncbi:MAG: Gamma-glutamyltransferase [Conexibacter sp.]|nr:Gamma-glutamyltransferase [Conexibacter sp.]
MVEGERGVLAAESPEAGRAGAEILAGGGNAVDAAVAIGFCAAVTQPAATTIAGSGFLIAHGPAGAWSIEFPPRAPLAAAADMYRLVEDLDEVSMMGVAPVCDAANDVGARALGVPGVVAGLCTAHRHLGRLPLEAVVAPAVALAADGFETGPALQLATLAALPALRDDPELSAILLDEQGLPTMGDLGFTQAERPVPRIRQPKLAELLASIGERGPAAFSTGPFADGLVEGIRSRGGILSLEDLSGYRPLVAGPVAVRVGPHKLLLPSSPSGAWTVAQLLVAWTAAEVLGEDAAQLHRRIELARHVFADRYHFMGDPAQARIPLEELLSERHARDLARLADVERASFRFDDDSRQPWNRFAVERPHRLTSHGAGERFGRPLPAGLGDSRETTHFSVRDEAGLMVSCTTTAANSFGARVMCDGVLFDDAMIWFNARPGFANSIGPWKRPLVNMSPVIVVREDGARLAIGAPGGRRIVSAVAEVVRRWLQGAPLGEALDAPRIDVSGREVIVSPRMAPALRDEVAARGHPVRMAEDRDPFSYEYAHPVAVSDEGGRGVGGVHPFCPGYVAAL